MPTERATRPRRERITWEIPIQVAIAMRRAMMVLTKMVMAVMMTIQMLVAMVTMSEIPIPFQFCWLGITATSSWQIKEDDNKVKEDDRSSMMTGWWRQGRRKWWQGWGPHWRWIMVMAYKYTVQPHECEKIVKNLRITRSFSTNTTSTIAFFDSC